MITNDTANASSEGMDVSEDVNDKKDVAKRFPLEIHHISVSGGDATVIAVRKNPENDKPPDELILIDSGNSLADTQIVLSYCKEHLGKEKFDKIILSHSHKDHFGGLSSYNGSASKDEESGSKDEPTEVYTGAYISAAYVNSFNNNLTRKYIPHGIGYRDVINLNHDITLTCYCAVGNSKDEKEQKRRAEKGEPIYNDENDLSLAWILRYGNFRYFTAGDLSGAKESNYTNIEKELIEQLYKNGGPLDGVESVQVIKATHHGSKHSMFAGDGSTNENGTSIFLDKMKPEVIIVPCSNSEKLPANEFFLRIVNDEEEWRKEVKIWFVNQLQRLKSNRKEGIGIEYNGIWADKKRSNIFLQDDLNFHNNQTSATDNKVYLPVCMVGVSEDGKYEDFVRYIIDHENIKESKLIGKKILNRIPHIIPWEFLELPEVYNNYFHHILIAFGIEDSDAGYITALYEERKDGDYDFSRKQGDDKYVVMYEKFCREVGFDAVVLDKARGTRTEPSKYSTETLKSFLNRLENKVTPVPASNIDNKRKLETTIITETGKEKKRRKIKK